MPPIHKGEYSGYFLSVTSTFDTKCKIAGARFHRFQDVYGRLRAVIAADPSQGGSVSPIPDDGVLVFEKDGAVELPGLRIRYRYFGNRLLFVDIDVW